MILPEFLTNQNLWRFSCTPFTHSSYTTAEQVFWSTMCFIECSTFSLPFAGEQSFWATLLWHVSLYMRFEYLCCNSWCWRWIPVKWVPVVLHYCFCSWFKSEGRKITSLMPQKKIKRQMDLVAWWNFGNACIKGFHLSFGFSTTF